MKNRINEIISLSDSVLLTRRSSDYGDIVDEKLFRKFRSESLYFIKKSFGEDHLFYKEFNEETRSVTPYCVTEGRDILKAVKNEIDGDRLFKLKDVVSPEIVSDFLETTEYFRNENNKDAAAFDTGSLLEEHLRRFCIKNGIT